MNSLVVVPFYGDLLEAVLDEDGNVLVSARRVCDVLGLAVQSQLAKLHAAPWAVVTMIVTTGRDGKRYQMAMVNLDTLLMWLATIDAGRVGPGALRAKLELYQRECVVALRRHFLVDRAAPAPVAVPAPSLDSVNNFLQLAKEFLTDGGVMDRRDFLQIQDVVRTRLMLLGPSGATLPEGIQHVTLPERCLELGYGRPGRGEDSAVGKAVAVRYRAAHGGRNPPQHDQSVDGRIVRVNSYTTADLDVVDAGIRDYYRRRDRGRVNGSSQRPGGASVPLERD